jgi:hypothetical protein
VPGDLDRASAHRDPSHRPGPGGTLSQHTLVMDVFVAETVPALLSRSVVQNTDDTPAGEQFRPGG